MQNVTCVELKMNAKAMSEDAFGQLKQAFAALGGAEETDVDSGDVFYIAWFAVQDDQEQQYLRLKTGALLLGAAASELHIHTLNDDWATAWQKHWQAVRIGVSLCVRPSFCAALPDRDVDIVLDPGMAFGTGTHPTTALCLQAVERYCLAQRPSSVLDMGAGSGLLAIAAGKMGASDIHAVDYDPISVQASAVNAEINGITLTSTLGDTPPDRQFELVVANILAGPLLDMAQPLSAAVGQHLILSGLLIAQAPTVIKAYEQAGLQHLTTHHDAEWAAVELKRR
ncbi:MAG: 50S ribosomal protein L11 methyltransferase [Mariprofundaceae bacterium]|nr:50S ribosomal protein L11 methyltransferase [Mariprofundaceae bacterium]